MGRKEGERQRAKRKAFIYFSRYELISHDRKMGKCFGSTRCRNKSEFIILKNLLSEENSQTLPGLDSIKNPLRCH